MNDNTVHRDENATVESVSKFLGVEPDTWSDVRKPGVWFRVQPSGMGLDHKTETSGGSEVDGVHVVENLEQAMELEGQWLYRKTPHEVVAISGPDELPDSGDVEGFFLKSGKGKILARFGYQSLLSEYQDAEE